MIKFEKVFVGVVYVVVVEIRNVVVETRIVVVVVVVVVKIRNVVVVEI